MKLVYVEQGVYADSVFLMRLNARLEAEPGVHRALVAMATEANLDLARMLEFVVSPAGPDELLICLDHDGSVPGEELRQLVHRMIREKRGGLGSEETGVVPTTVMEALQVLPQATLAVISVAGTWAVAEADKALDAGLSVMLFSDNVTVEQEARLKGRALEKGLLMMGPDCGTAIIGGTPLCFSNAVRPGPVGIVAASGTGLQEVSCLIHRLGSGISHAIGTGGRDLKEPTVSGQMIRAGIAALEADPGTDVIVVISKPPADELARALWSDLEGCTKPVVVHLVGGSPSQCPADMRAVLTDTLAETARAAVGLIGMLDDGGVKPAVLDRSGPAAPQPRRGGIHGLYTGGTLADEADGLMRRVPDLEYTVIDLGDDQYTRGRAHPMIDPTARVEWIRKTTADTTVAVILLDFVLGYGSHPDPVGMTLPAITGAREGVVFVAALVGTDGDPQGYDECLRRLEEAGVLVAGSNAEAVDLAIRQVSNVRSARDDSRGWRTSLHHQHQHQHQLQPQPKPQPRGDTPAQSALLHSPVQVINIGIQDFADDLQKQGVSVVHLAWRPPARGNERMAALLNRLR